MTIRILLADPDEGVLDGFDETLSGHGFTILTASNEHACMSRLSEFAPHVLVLEPDVEGSWGRRVLERVTGQMPVVVVSRFRRVGSPVAPEIWLTKPVNSEELKGSLEQALAKTNRMRN